MNLTGRIECVHGDSETLANQSAGRDLFAAETWSQRVESLLVRIGASSVPVLLQGETGAGKEVVARKLHSFSKRREGPFVKVNCAALPSELVESELFGYERGAFTGAFKNTPGKFEMAHKGTIFLDEIGDMDLKLQAKLLQVLQDQEFYRLGSHEPSRIDVRIMAASHCNFEKAIAERRFREDLFYRLNIVDIKVPPLRERRNEIRPLCELFLQRYATAEWPALEIPPSLWQVLLEYHWPGNVRELENMMRKYLVIRNAGVLTAEIRQKTVKGKMVHISPDHAEKATRLDGEGELNVLRSSESSHWRGEFLNGTPEVTHPRPIPIRDIAEPHELPRPTLVSRQPAPLERETRSTLSKVDELARVAEAEAILTALQSSLWNRKRAAILLNVDYKALLYKMKKLGIGERKAVS